MLKFLTVRGAALIALATLTGCASAAVLERPLAANAPTVATAPQIVEAAGTSPAVLDTSQPTPAATSMPMPATTPTAIRFRPAPLRPAPVRTPVTRAVPAAVAALPPHPAAALRPLTAASGNWSGYVEAGSFSQVSGSWTEPTVRCTAPDATLALWVGLGGDGSLPLYQAGSGAMCRNGSPVHFLWYELLTAAQQPPQVIVREIAPGDVVAVSVGLRGAGGGGSIQLADRTAGYATTVGFAAPETTLDTAEWITEATTTPSTGTITPLADFGTVDFHSCTANQGTEGIGSAAAGHLTALLLHDASGGTATPGGVSPDGSGPGGSFSVTYGR
ncbi:MAG TPA: G1 family glutamic endopeptidase [Candidatus Dormibacteraeota bacterium]